MQRHVKTPNQHYLRGSFQNAGRQTTVALLLEQKQKLEIGERIKWLRDNSAERSRTIARYADVSDEAVRNWIAGKGIAWENAEKVAALFKIDIDWLWRGTGKAPEGYPQPEKGETPDPFAKNNYGERLDNIEKLLGAIVSALVPLLAEQEARQLRELEAGTAAQKSATRRKRRGSS